jgi:arylsulfatase B
MSSWGHIPHGRGFDTSLVYFEGAEDHWTQRSCCDPECIVPVTDKTIPPPGLPNFNGSAFDFWRDTAPASDLVETQYNGYMFNDQAVGVINAHDEAVGPLFMYLAPANSHTPLEAPQRFLDLYPSDWYLDRRQYAAMCSFWDEILGNVTAALKARSLWANTLLSFSADNGGPVYWSAEPERFPHGAGANNWPLLGGKTSNWEGGVRAVAFVSGGFVPPAMRGTKLSGSGALIHMSDWYATYCHLAGVPPTDAAAAAAGLPPVDSLNVWPLLSGANTTSPRSEIVLAVDALGRKGGLVSSSALIVGEFKYLEGKQLQTYHQGPDFPNASSVPYGSMLDPSLWKLCGDGSHPLLEQPCLFNIFDDPTEQHNLAESQPERLKAMRARLNEHRATKFQPPSDTSQKDQCIAQVKANGNFYGPWIQ